MEGSSAFQFGRVAFRAGLLSRRQLIADGLANLRFRLQGASDEATHALRDRISASLAGTRVRDLDRLGAAVLAGILPRIYPQMLAVAHEHQDAGRRVYICTAASQDLAEMLAGVLALDGAIGSQFSAVKDGVYTGEPAGCFVYGEDKARAMRELAAREGIDLAASFAYSDSASDLPMLRVGRSRGRRQPRRRARPRRAGGGLADPALRPPRPAPEDRGGAHRRGHRRRRRLRRARAGDASGPVRPDAQDA